ncbi:MAG TPA: protein kinase [Chlamydiales bacterium]|nr:protein kinase [Chlamydiales bacterium]
MGLPFVIMHVEDAIDSLSTSPKVGEHPHFIGPYEILQSLGKGGMGEVFLAKDPSCGRKVALKRIRPELRASSVIQSRFLREANVASALTHPSIVPILSIANGGDETYYTMPYIEGEMLRQILRRTKTDEHPVGYSIPSLTRIFLQVCQAIAYAHSRGVIHRDLKPENIIVGRYGEVMILDWGIADFIDQLEKEEPFNELPQKEEHLTRPGKIAGTLAYMPPERLRDNHSSTQTDLYALGVILYQILTLQLPFQRKTIAQFRKIASLESLIDPIEAAPYRDIPPQLSSLCKKCLASDPKERYENVEQLIADLKNYIEGKPDWALFGTLDLNRKEDWQFQEHILLAKQVAITRSLDRTEWAVLMISKTPYPENLMIEIEIRMGKEGQGVGFLLNVPESGGRKSLEEGYCLWIGSEKDPSCRLFRNNVQVMEAKGVFPKSNEWHKLRIEKIADQLKFYLDGQLKISFTSHLPLAGHHLGLLQKDNSFEIKEWNIFDRTNDVMVRCLAVPNSFLSHKLYDLALREYRRIGQAFPGRMEGREALFRAGLTLLEKGKALKEDRYIHLALKEFEKLYRTPGAPLEYLGKAFVYETLGDLEEEAKCLELALRRFPKHPQLPMLKEQILYRMHQSSLNNREAAYRMILIALRHIPDLLDHPDSHSLIENLVQNWEPLPFIEDSTEPHLSTVIPLAFWLAATPILVEILDVLSKKISHHEVAFANALFCLVELEAFEKVEKYLSCPSPCVEQIRQALTPLTPKLPSFDRGDLRVLYYQMSRALNVGQLDLIEWFNHELDTSKMRPKERLSFDALFAWCYLLQKKLPEAEAIFRKAPLAAIMQEHSPLHFPYGTWLHLEKGPSVALSHFGAVLDSPYPPTSALPSLFLSGKFDEKKGWIERAFWWEKKELNRQLSLYSQVTGTLPEKSM